MDRKDFLTAVIGSLLGLIPLFVTALLNWLDKRGRLARKEEEINFAQERVSFLSAWLQAREQAEGGEDSTGIKKAIALELDGIKQNLDPILLEAHAQPVVKVKERHFVQRLLLLYPPHKLVGWVFRGLFYMCLSGIAFFAVPLIVPYQGQGLNPVAYVEGSLCLVIPSLLLAVLLHYLATRSDAEAEKDLHPANAK